MVQLNDDCGRRLERVFHARHVYPQKFKYMKGYGKASQRGGVLVCSKTWFRTSDTMGQNLEFQSVVRAGIEVFFRCRVAWRLELLSRDILLSLISLVPSKTHINERISPDLHFIHCSCKQVLAFYSISQPFAHMGCRTGGGIRIIWLDSAPKFEHFIFSSRVW